MSVIRTPRLWLRPLTMTDVDAVDALNRAPGVLRYLESTPPTRDQVAERIADVIGRARPGLERCGITDLDGTFVGWCGVWVSDHGPVEPLHVELGYRLRPEFWGLGIASEAASALVDRAFLLGDAEVVFARTMAVNDGSRGVMRRVGLTHVATTHEHFDDPLPGTEHAEVRYELTRADWHNRRVDPRAALRAALTSAMRRRDRPAMSALRVASAAVANAEALPTASDRQPTTARSADFAGTAIGVGAADAERVWLSDSAVVALIAAERADASPDGAAALDEVLVTVAGLSTRRRD